MNGPNDTGPRAEELLIAGYRRMTAREKMERVAALNETIRRLAAAGIRARHGDIGDAEVRRRVAALTLGAETMRKILPRGR